MSHPICQPEPVASKGESPMSIPWRDVLKFLSGAFFVTAGASWYFWQLNMPVPFFGTMMTPEFLFYRGCLHFGLFLASFYYGFVKQARTPPPG